MADFEELKALVDAGNWQRLVELGMPRTLIGREDIWLYGYNPQTGFAFKPEEAQAFTKQGYAGYKQVGEKTYGPGDVIPGESLAEYAARFSEMGGGSFGFGGKTYIMNRRGQYYQVGTQEPADFLDTTENLGNLYYGSTKQIYGARTAKIIDPTKGKAVGYDKSGNIIYENQGSGTLKPTDVVNGTGTTQSPLVVNGIPYTGTYNSRSYTNGVLSGVADSAGQKFDGSGTTNSPLTVNGEPYNGVLGGVTYTNGIAQASFTEADVETKARRSAQQDFKAILNELGLGDLVDTVDEMIKQDFTVANIKLELPKTGAYINRFPGMAALRAAGRSISEAQYISNERGYLQTLRAYGLDTNVLGSRAELGKYIQNEVSPREFEERVNLAATRVRENPDVLNSFKSFYPEVDASGVVAYLLNPKQGLDIIKKQVKTVEIGSAAQAAGFAKELVGIAEAGSLMTAVGETNYAGLVNEFRQARQLAMNQRRLASIEGQQYTDLEAIGAVVGDNLEQGLASQRRASRETARFAGSSGISGASLRSTVSI